MIGQGGMSRVYDVVHVELEKRFVLKVLSHELVRRSDLVARLRTEWRALGQLEHPNIVNVTDAGTTPQGVPFYVMERLEGETLSARLRRERRLALGTAVDVVLGVLDGLGAAHQIGIVHRDVKPANVFLTTGGGVKLLDFGIAKLLRPSDPSVTSRGMAIGTPRYMSPEQARGEHVDGRADLYAAGLLLFEMLAGRGPFDQLSEPQELLLAHMVQVPPKLRTVVPGVPAEVDELVASMLAKDPRARPATARVVADVLRETAPGTAVEASAAGLSTLRDQGTLLRYSAPMLPAMAEGDATQPDATDGALTVVERDPTTLRALGAQGAEREATTWRRPLGPSAPLGLTDTVVMAAAPGQNLETARLPLAPVAGGLATDPTVRLGDLEPIRPQVAELDDTRTQVPAPDSVSATPPPVVPVVGPKPTPKRATFARWAGLAAVAAMSFAVAVTSLVLVRMRWSDAAGTQPAAVSSVPVVAAAEPLPEPLPLPSEAPPAASASTPAPAVIEEPRPPEHKPQRTRPAMASDIDLDAPGPIARPGGRRLPRSTR
jgi:tRNA A-37 threonylcarbamoyl transferase component Bud32